MNIPDIILKRRSIRSFTPQKVELEKTEVLLKAAMLAPSAKNKQPWNFIVIDDRSILDKIMEVHPYSKMFSTANLGILVCGDLVQQHDTGYWIADCAAATENLLLAATAIGLGSCWVGIYPREERMNAMKVLFALPHHVKAFALVALGYAAEEKKVPERYHPEKIHLNQWNAGFSK
jgi:nitroreductase